MELFLLLLVLLYKLPSFVFCLYFVVLSSYSCFLCNWPLGCYYYYYKHRRYHQNHHHNQNHHHPILNGDFHVIVFYTRFPPKFCMESCSPYYCYMSKSSCTLQPQRPRNNVPVTYINTDVSHYVILEIIPYFAPLNST